jgi:hypothetical protein
MNGGKTKQPKKQIRPIGDESGENGRPPSPRRPRPVLIFAPAGFNIGVEELSL